jgi:hypothetical protein
MKLSSRPLATLGMDVLLAACCALIPAFAHADDSIDQSGARVAEVARVGSKFVYTSYMKTTPEALWKALTTSAVIKQYWGGLTIESDWKAGAAWSSSYLTGESPTPARSSNSTRHGAWSSDQSSAISASRSAACSGVQRCVSARSNTRMQVS